MTRGRVVVATVVLTLVMASRGDPAAQTQAGGNIRGHVAWVEESLARMETIKPGMTRGDLLKVFTTEGGLSSRTAGHFVFRDCPYFKVDVEFQTVEPGTLGRTIAEGSDADLIKTISRPYIQRRIFD